MVSTRRRLSDASATCLMCSGRLDTPPGRLAVGVEREVELGGDHHLPAKRFEGFVRGAVIAVALAELRVRIRCEMGITNCQGPTA